MSIEYSVLSMNTIKDFTDLVVWKKGHIVVLDIYVITKGFPSNEAFGLVSQMQRCTVSFTSNVAEGFSRRTKKEKLQFYYTALGSLSELRNQLMIARDLKYISVEKYQELEGKCLELRRLINGLIKSSMGY